MLGSLRARLIISFSLVVGLAVFLAGIGALFLLRDQQQATARERYGHLAEPISVQVAALQQTGTSLADMRPYLDAQAAAKGVRVLLLDADLFVVYDSDRALEGKYVLSFSTFNVRTYNSQGTSFRWVDYDSGNTHLTLFAAPPVAPGGTFRPAAYETIVAIPQSKLAAAWHDLVPSLALAGLISLTVSFLVSFFISRSISGPLARITQASRQMARGDYDVHIPIRGEDEVGRLAEAFNAMAQQVGTSQRMMKDLLANVSHELKTPLTSIQGYSQAMVEGAVRELHDYRESGRIIHEEANRMRALVDDLLLLSQIESGQMTMQLSYIDLPALLQRMLERFQWAFRESDITARLRVGKLGELRGDERRLEQVFSNLIENAVRHTPRDGTVTVNAASEPDGAIRVGVHNTGSVIPAEDLPRVFERFFQVDRARARKGGSSGLGLSIVAEIVEAHGGTVRAESAAATGTEFIVTLPAARPQPARNGRGAAPGDAKRPPRRPTGQVA